ncbi:MAG: DUF3368 domain-containing protein [Anaerolineae bacterium]|nr:DUF3368 domain-containing protein [Anaerolineae bacterium]
MLLLAKEEGLVTAIAPLLAQLLENGLYLDESVVRQALLLAGE